MSRDFFFFFFREDFEPFFHIGVKKLVNQVINEIFRQMTITLTLALDVPVRPVDAKGLICLHFDVRFSPLIIKTKRARNFRMKTYYPLVPYPHTYVALYNLHAKVTCNTHTKTRSC